MTTEDIEAKKDTSSNQRGETQTETNQSLAIYQKGLCPVRLHSLRACQRPRENICPALRSLREKSPFQMVVLRGGGIMRGGLGVSASSAFPGDALMCGILCIANAGRKTGWLFFSLPPVCMVFIEEIGDPIQRPIKLLGVGMKQRFYFFLLLLEQR
ncbi:hypothetical protein CEXT_394761 [Caerostris extrusa]|uniref:Uncharacterized protein n=1 Tax=Caerostris extrusa TaxID=172846 RepID=A0AAV4X835_CAEEX|nr:hypothetical protein CEXT_394761 [Caerostris extrusa]